LSVCLEGMKWGGREFVSLEGILIDPWHGFGLRWLQ